MKNLWVETGRLTPVSVAASLPERADVVVVGGGYTGLAAARELARSGASAVVLEAKTIGFGASSRNGGFVLPGFKADPGELVRRFGPARARALFEASLEAVSLVDRVITEERIECHWRRCGHVTLAARPGHIQGLRDTQRVLQRELGHDTILLGPAELAGELDSGRYHGGLLDDAAGVLQPAEYLHGLALAAGRAGATLVEAAPVTSLARERERWRVATLRGSVVATDVLVATNGYTRRLVPWLARRVVPVGSFLIATRPLDSGLARRLIPRGRVLSDTKNLLYYFRLSPDSRMVFGGRAAFSPEALDRSLALLRKGMTEVFPALAGAEVEYGWGGTLGFTRDHLPHAGRRGEVCFALGYGGHGVALATWLGHRVGAAIAGRGAWPLLAEVPFPAIPLYAGRPWFLPLAGAYYGLKDRLA